jgi:hypothetical protein
MGLYTRQEGIAGSVAEPAETWRKSSRSYTTGGCVEVACLSSELIGVRDSKNPRGIVLRFTRAGWDAFVGSFHNGEFDRHR